MPNCHQCARVTGVGARDGDCKTCYSKGVHFCQVCAMWELGPKDADVDLATELRKAERDLDAERQDRDKDVDALNKIGDEPLICDVFLPTMGEVCPFFKDQLTNGDATLYGKQFKVYTCSVLDKFQELYPTCKYDRLALQVLIATHLSAQERVQCRDKKDANAESTSAAAKPVKRWQTRTLAAAHLRAHLGDVQAKLGKAVRDVVERPAWLYALGCDDLELYMKGLEHPTLAAVDLLAATGGAAAAREALEVWLIVYHALTATRSRGEVGAHWCNKQNDFIPKEALGLLSEEHFVHLYGDVGTAQAYSDEATARIERLWNVLGDVDPGNALPAHPRYADGTVSGHGLLDAVEKRYLQYLPTFDHDEAHAVDRTGCETAVRTRVVATLKSYLSSYAPAEWREEPTLATPFGWKAADETKGKTKYLVVTATSRPLAVPLTLTFGPSTFHASTTLTVTEKGKIDVWLADLLRPDELRAHGGRLTLELEGETGNTRRSDRRDAVTAALTESFDRLKARFSRKPAFVGDDGAFKNDAPVATFVDDLMVKMRDGFAVDQAFDNVVSKIIVGNATRNATFTPKAWFPLKTTMVAFSALLPDCPFGVEELATVADHYARVEGSSARPAHYMDWRNHKDHWLYDCFAIEQTRRPVFGSLSTQPYLPAPNPNYGGHILFYARDRINGRAVYTFGDKQQPRRSMLLVLDTILHGRTKKDGGAAQKPEHREEVIYRLLRRYDNIVRYAGATPEEMWQKTFEGKKVPYPDGDLLIECQVFGGITMATDVWGYVPEIETGAFYDDRFHIKTEDLQAAGIQLATLYPNLKVLPYVFSQTQAIASENARGAPWKHHLSEIDE